MIERPRHLETVLHRLKQFPVAILLGPRQVGKTTLARQIESQWTAGSTHFFDLEDPADLARLQNPRLALEALEGLVILDEIQLQPDLFSLLRVLADRPGPPARFLILGSASPDVRKQSAETLAGRAAFIDLPGLSLGEVDFEQATLWWRGGFPRAFLAGSDENARLWQDAFIRTFLERDIPALGIRIPAATLRRFWSMVAHYHGQLWKGADFARSLGTSEPTVRNYLDILTETFVVRQLPPWFENLAKRQVKAPKTFIRDSGIAHALLLIDSPGALQGHPKLGASWEGFAIEQLLMVSDERQAFFWATHAGAELDLLLFHKGYRLGFEFKYSDRPSTTKSMRIAMEDLALDRLYVVHPGDACFPLDTGIEAVSLRAAVAQVDTMRPKAPQ